jgi:hypothetical protein
MTLFARTVRVRWSCGNDLIEFDVAMDHVVELCEGQA